MKSIMIILLHTFEGDISFLVSLPLFHAYVFFSISPHTYASSMHLAIRGTLELVHALEEFPSLKGSQRQVDKLVMIV